VARSLRLVNEASRELCAAAYVIRGVYGFTARSYNVAISFLRDTPGSIGREYTWSFASARHYAKEEQESERDVKHGALLRSCFSRRTLSKMELSDFYMRVRASARLPRQRNRWKRARQNEGER